MNVNEYYEHELQMRGYQSDAAQLAAVVNGGQKATSDGGVDQKYRTILFCRTVF